MPTIAVLPIKSFQLGKGRLAGALDSISRESLGRALAERTLQIAESAALLPVVVAGDDDVASWSVARGVPAIADPGKGLSPAVTEGVEWAEAAAMSWLVLHADLPLLTADELSRCARAVDSGRDVISPSADGGTSLLGSRRAIPFVYGPGSFSRHLPLLDDPLIIWSLGLSHDLDNPADLVSALSHPRSRWLKEFLR